MIVKNLKDFVLPNGELYHWDSGVCSLELVFSQSKEEMHRLYELSHWEWCKSLSRITKIMILLAWAKDTAETQKACPQTSWCWEIIIHLKGRRLEEAIFELSIAWSFAFKPFRCQEDQKKVWKVLCSRIPNVSKRIQPSTFKVSCRRRGGKCS